MAISYKNIASGNNTDTNLNTILTVGQGRSIMVYSCIFTNNTANNITVSIYLNDGTDRLYETVKIPAGIGKALTVNKMKTVTLEGNQTIKIQAASADSFNYKLNGDELS